MYPSRGIHPELKLKAITLAKKPGGLGRGGTVGASAAAQILNLKEKSIRSWLKREEEILQEAEVAGVNLSYVEGSLSEVPGERVRRTLKNQKNLLDIKFCEPMKEWVIERLKVSNGYIDYRSAVDHARTLDPNFFLSLPNDAASSQAKASYKRRAREWFKRFCIWNDIDVKRRDRRGGSRTSRQFDPAFKIKAIDMEREVVDGGRGPGGTRGKEATARYLGISSYAIWHWEQNEASLRQEVAPLKPPHQPALQQQQTQSPLHRTEQQSDYHVKAVPQDVAVQTVRDEDPAPHLPVIILPSEDESFHSVSSSVLGDIRLLSA